MSKKRKYFKTATEQDDLIKEKMRKRKLRKKESNQQTEFRNEQNKARMQKSRSIETVEQKKIRLKEERIRRANSRSNEIKYSNKKRLLNSRKTVKILRKKSIINLTNEGFNYQVTNDYSQHFNIGEMNTICIYCDSMKFARESLGMCCSNGKICLPLINEPPDSLKYYMSGKNANSNHFLKNIRKYNICFQMTSFGATNIVRTMGFQSTFKIQGQIYHQIGSLLPTENDDEKYLQIYFIGDDNLEANKRSTITNGTRREIILDLQYFFHNNNKIIQMFKTSLDKMPSDEYKIKIRADKIPKFEHKGRFNIPTQDEVAIIITNIENEKRDIIIQKKDNKLKRIYETHRLYDALQYPIIFWQGQDGYHFNITQHQLRSNTKKEKKVTYDNTFNDKQNSISN